MSWEHPEIVQIQHFSSGHAVRLRSPPPTSTSSASASASASTAPSAATATSATAHSRLFGLSAVLTSYHCVVIKSLGREKFLLLCRKVERALALLARFENTPWRSLGH
eukprot:m.116648 g.116648  ORF g.116648 m.116648 type:complete len:108 (+) comp13151_c1_seq2:6714-7037(+)